MVIGLRAFRKKSRLPPLDGLEEPRFGDRPQYLQEYLERVERSVGRSLVVERLSSDMKRWKKFNVLYPVGGGVFIHVYSLERDVSGYNKYIVVEPPRPHPKLLKLVEEAIALNISSEHVLESDEEKKRLLLHLLERILVAVEEVDYDRLKIKLGRIPVKKEDVNYLKYHLIREKIGVGILEPFLRDPYLEDISLSGVGNFYVIHKFFGPLESNLGFKTEEELDSFIIKLAEKIGKPISTARPIVDATLPDGSRINIVYGSDVSLRGSNLTIRKVASVPISVTQLIDWGTFDSRIAAYTWMMLEAGMSVFVCGETASGKTTSLNALAVFIRPNAKIVSIEDTAEVTLPHPNWTRELTRETGKPESSVTMFDLLRAALRQRPNYIIVGEIRGAEGNIAFQAMQSVSWDTPIALRVGRRKILLTTIGRVVDGLLGESATVIRRVVESMQTLSLDNRGKLVWSPVSEVQKHISSDIYKVVYNGGEVLYATGHHSVFTLDPSELLVKPTLVSKLKSGDFLISFKRSRGAGARVLPLIERILSSETFTVSEEVSDRAHRNWVRALSRAHGTSRKFPLKPILDFLDRFEVELPRELRYLRARLHNGTQSFIEESTLRRLYVEIKSCGGEARHQKALSRLKALLDSDISIVQVERVEPVEGVESVYDLSVPGTQLFLGGEFPIALHNTGHPVLATFHAASLDRLIQRLTNPPISVPKTNMDNLNIAWFQSAVHVKGFPARRVIEIDEIIGYDPEADAIAAMPVFVWDATTDRFIFSGRGSSYLLEEKIAIMRGIPRSRIAEIYDELELRRRYIDLLVRNKVFEYNRVFRAVTFASQVGLERAVASLESGRIPF